MDDNLIGEYIRRKRKEAGYSQKEFAFLSGLGFRFVQELERGKQTVRLDKVNQALKMFGARLVPEQEDGDGKR